MHNCISPAWYWREQATLPWAAWLAEKVKFLLQYSKYTTLQEVVSDDVRMGDVANILFSLAPLLDSIAVFVWLPPYQKELKRMLCCYRNTINAVTPVQPQMADTTTGPKGDSKQVMRQGASS